MCVDGDGVVEQEVTAVRFRCRCPQSGNIRGDAEMGQRLLCHDYCRIYVHELDSQYHVLGRGKLAMHVARRERVLEEKPSDIEAEWTVGKC